MIWNHNTFKLRLIKHKVRSFHWLRVHLRLVKEVLKETLINIIVSTYPKRNKIIRNLLRHLILINLENHKHLVEKN
jgi:hypothetical protein